MGQRFSHHDLTQPSRRRAAWRALMLGDHGVLRKLYDNTHELDPGVMWRTYQPSPARLKSWKDQGIKTVINLRGVTPSGHYLLEEEACHKLGLALINFRVYSREAPARDTIHAAQRLFDEIEYPALMHCKSGADRAGLMAVLYQFFKAGKPFDEALSQLSFKYGHVRQGKTGVIDHALEAYLVHARQNDNPLTDQAAFLHWVDHDYDPVSAKDTFMSTWWGRLWADKLLRRE